MASLRNLTSGAALTAALVAAACMGQIGIGDDETSRSQNPDGTTPVDSSGQPLTLRPMVVSRLNRLEYNNTVRDLLGTTLTPANGFPADGMAGGFETVGSALSLSPTYVIAYEWAGHELIEDLFSDPESDRFNNIVHCDVEDTEQSDSCARSILRDFARKAWRRPVTDEQLDSVLIPFETAKNVGATAVEGLKHSLVAVLMSPFFIFKLEIDSDPNSTEARPLNPYELATRLSYALWSTMPDQELMEAADAGALSTDEEITAQIDRMLDDPRSDALLEGFAARWLDFSRIDTHEVEGTIFPQYNSQLASSMRQEARMFVHDFLHSDRPATEMMTAGFTYVDSRLAAHYGLPFEGSSPNEFVRVDTSSAQRVGLLTLGAILTTTSFSSRTSPVLRGEFIFSHLLCGSVPPPPPGVEGLPVDTTGLTLRERLELHREDPSCAGCHMVMDPLGYGLEHFDAIGRYRTNDGAAPIDATGELPDGSTFDGALELSNTLRDDPELTKCLTKKFLIYSAGRLLTGRNDDAWVAHLNNQAAEIDGGSLRSIVRTALLSDLFRNRVPNGT